MNQVPPREMSPFSISSVLMWWDKYKVNMDFPTYYLPSAFCFTFWDARQYCYAGPRLSHLTSCMTTSTEKIVNRRRQRGRQHSFMECNIWCGTCRPCQLYVTRQARLNINLLLINRGSRQGWITGLSRTNQPLKWHHALVKGYVILALDHA